MKIQVSMRRLMLVAGLLALLGAGFGGATVAAQDGGESAEPWWSPNAPNSPYKRYLTPHYNLITDVDAKIVELIEAELEKNYEMYGKFLAPHVEVPSDLRWRHTVRIFNTLDDFQRYHAQRWREDSPRLNFVFHYTQDLRFREVCGYMKPIEPFFASLRHEGFHQVFRAQIGYPPQWLNEGLAELLEETRMVDGNPVPRINKGWARQLREQIGRGRRYRVVPVAELMRMGKSVWVRESGGTYAQSWALVWYLKYEFAGGEEILARYLKALKADGQRDDNVETAWAATFGGEDADSLGKLANGFEQFIREVSPTPDYAGFEAARRDLAASDEAGALEKLNAVIARDDEFYAAFYYRAVAFEGLNRRREALFDLLRARQLFPEYISAIWKAAELATDVGYFDLAEQMAAEAVRINIAYADRAETLRAQIATARTHAHPDLLRNLPPLPNLDGWPVPDADESDTDGTQGE